MANNIETSHILDQLTSTSNLGGFLNQYDNAMISDSLKDELNRLLADHTISISDLIPKTQLSKSYLYKIFSGEKMPSRDKLLQVIFAMGCPEVEVQRLLLLAGHAMLHPKVRRDAVLIFALNHKKNAFEVNQMLMDQKEAPLFSIY